MLIPRQRDERPTAISPVLFPGMDGGKGTGNENPTKEANGFDLNNEEAEDLGAEDAGAAISTFRGVAYATLFSVMFWAGALCILHRLFFHS